MSKRIRKPAAKLEITPMFVVEREKLPPLPVVGQKRRGRPPKNAVARPRGRPRLAPLPLKVPRAVGRPRLKPLTEAEIAARAEAAARAAREDESESEEEEVQETAEEREARLRELVLATPRRGLRGGVSGDPGSERGGAGTTGTSAARLMVEEDLDGGDSDGEWAPGASRGTPGAGRMRLSGWSGTGNARLASPAVAQRLQALGAFQPGAGPSEATPGTPRKRKRVVSEEAETPRKSRRNMGLRAVIDGKGVPQTLRNDLVEAERMQPVPLSEDVSDDWVEDEGMEVDADETETAVQSRHAEPGSADIDPQALDENSKMPVDGLRSSAAAHTLAVEAESDESDEFQEPELQQPHSKADSESDEPPESEWDDAETHVAASYVAPDIEDKPAAYLLALDSEPQEESRKTYSPHVFHQLVASMGGCLNRLQSASLVRSKWLGLSCYDKWRGTLNYALKSAFQDGAGESVIVIGPRGVGKTGLIEASLATARASVPHARIVRLSGLVHTTDRLALRAIASQLGVADTDANVYSNASTMELVIRLLESSAERSEGSSGSGSVAGAGAGLAANGTSPSAPPIAIILDEFDLFALHPRQSLLYSLFDVLQGNRRTYGLCIIGATARTDCMGMLEKRVRSRCQGVVLNMVLENSFDVYRDIARGLLQVEMSPTADQVSASIFGTLIAEWNAAVDVFISHKDTEKALHNLFLIYGTVSLAPLRQLFAKVFYRLDAALRNAIEKEQYVSVPTLVLPGATSPATAVSAAASAPRPDLSLVSLSVLQLTVCVAAITLPQPTFNFEEIYAHYTKHTAHSATGIFSRPFARNAFASAFDTLVQNELFFPLTNAVSSGYAPPARATPYRKYRCVIWHDTLAQAITRSDVPESLRRWIKLQ